MQTDPPAGAGQPAQILAVDRIHAPGGRRPFRFADAEHLQGRAAHFGRRHVGHQGVARRAANALADAVDQARGDNQPGAAGQRK